MKTKLFAFLLLSLIAFQTALGQGVIRGGAIGANGLPFLDHATPAPSAPFSTLSSDVAISYFDPSTPASSWYAPSNWGATIIAFTECLTLPSDSAYVDSARIVFDAISGDSVSVGLDPDSVVLNSTVGEYEHLDERFFDPSVTHYAYSIIDISTLTSDTVTIPFNHVAVPKNFHVSLLPRITTAGSVTAAYAIRGDSEATQVRTLANCHSTYIAINGNEVLSGVIDSNLTPFGDLAPLYTNFYMRLF